MERASASEVGEVSTAVQTPGVGSQGFSRTRNVVADHAARLSAADLRDQSGDRAMADGESRSISASTASTNRARAIDKRGVTAV